ncbi:hypothetical protein [Halopseudomonas pelagia]|uniref:hypothetical protein n=1 Tax=Halopseudomonas pelagia TaxID=553151 RepID=UPI0003AA1FE7|nr:hypothetical protein [Halopseudomonas pelagia]
MTRIEKIGNALAVPQSLAPDAEDVLGHVLFALKHEDINLTVLAQALPVSVAMKRQERQYLEALQAFSRPARDFWKVRWIDYGQYDFIFQGHETIYRYWDATPSVVLTLKMAQLTLEEELQKETTFLERYDTNYRCLDERFDVRGSDLTQLVMMCLSNSRKISGNRRKQYRYTVPEHVFDYIEEVYRRVM